MIKLYMLTNESLKYLRHLKINNPNNSVNLNKLFTKFFRARNASTMYQDASGLGLFVAKHIINAHGGEIWFKSQEGKGSTFYLSIPIIIN